MILLNGNKLWNEWFPSIISKPTLTVAHSSTPYATALAGTDWEYCNILSRLMPIPVLSGTHGVKFQRLCQYNLNRLLH